MANKLKEGEEVTINVPFTYSIGEVGTYSNKVLETVEDCMNEVREEIDAGVLNSTNVMMVELVDLKNL